MKQLYYNDQQTIGFLISPALVKALEHIEIEAGSILSAQTLKETISVQEDNKDRLAPYHIISCFPGGEQLDVD